MTVTAFALRPRDVWFFRDVRPFNQGDPAQTAMPSLFPPMPQTALGAVRWALARGLGWNGRGDWGGDQTIVARVGSGDSLGPLTCTGALLAMIDDRKRCSPLFPVPLALVGADSRGSTSIVRLRPGQPRRCDLGDAVRLPEPESDAPGYDPMVDTWLTAEGMRAFLASGVPYASALRRRHDLAPGEPRTGIAIDPANGRVVHGHFFRTVPVRPVSGLAVVVGLDSAPGKVKLPEEVRFGGEGHLAWIDEVEWPALPPVPALPVVGGKVHYTVTLITPADLGERWPGVGESLDDGLPGSIVAACVSRPVMIGGWRGFGAQSGPCPVRPCVAAGATWFMDAGAGMEKELGRRVSRAIGRRTEWGYGRVLIGAWR